MPTKTRTVRPGPHPQIVITEQGPLRTPDDWSLLPPGDATHTRRVKAAGPTWSVIEKRGRKTFSRGVWAPTETIERVRRTLDRERSTPQYKRRLSQQRARRDKTQREYVAQFERSVLLFLAFDPTYIELAKKMAHAIAEHATPVGSGTVARTKRIPIEERAEAAVIAWMRHQTTAYDNLVIPREKGRRREVRRMLARRSRTLLERYRRGEAIPAGCPLSTALADT